MVESKSQFTHVTALVSTMAYDIKNGVYDMSLALRLNNPAKFINIATKS